MGKISKYTKKTMDYIAKNGYKCERIREKKHTILRIDDEFNVSISKTPSSNSKNSLYKLLATIKRKKKGF